MTANPLLIAIDGPAASGKGTVARLVAEHFGLAYLDTGKIYRVVGQKMLRAVVDIGAADDHESVEALLAVEIAQKLSMNDVVNACDLSSENVGRAASIVSAIPAVRAALLVFQQQVAGSPEGAVLDGRDIGTVVCPDADVKFFITADLKIRADRRYKQLHELDKHVTKAAVLQDLEMRDARDKKRAAAPLKPAEDAIILDTSHMGIEAVFDEIVAVIESSVLS